MFDSKYTCLIVILVILLICEIFALIYVLSKKNNTRFSGGALPIKLNTGMTKTEHPNIDSNMFKKFKTVGFRPSHRPIYILHVDDFRWIYYIMHERKFKEIERQGICRINIVLNDAGGQNRVLLRPMTKLEDIISKIPSKYQNEIDFLRQMKEVHLCMNSTFWNTHNSSHMSGIPEEDLVMKSEAFNFSFINDLDTSNIVEMESTFENSDFEYTYFLRNWNVSNVKKMSGMFASCGQLQTLDHLRNWDVSNVVDMHRMFSCCRQLQTLDPLRNWDVRNVVNMSNMFFYTGKNITPSDVFNNVNPNCNVDSFAN